MQINDFADTGLVVPRLGLGCGPLGDPEISDATAARLIDVAMERGLTLFDTARSYGPSESRLGRALEGRRDRAMISTKVGYGVEGHADWTGGCIAAGIDRALRELRTDVIDIVHLHSCPASVLSDEAILRAVEDARRAGKIRVAAYSGENEDLAAALATGVFGAVQLSVSVWDQAGVRAVPPGVGVIAKRPLANAAWSYEHRPEAPDVAEYWDRHRALALDPGDLDWPSLALRYAAHHPGVHTTIAGTRRPERIHALADAVLRGPLDAERIVYVEDAWARVGGAWRGVI